MKLHRALPWFFAALVLLTGVPLLFFEARDAMRPWAGPVLLSLAGFTFSLCWEARFTGEIRLRSFRYRREQQPRRYLATLLLLLATSAGVLTAGILVLLGRL